MKTKLTLLLLFVTALAFAQPKAEPKPEVVNIELKKFTKDQIEAIDKAIAEISAPDFVEKQKAILNQRKEAIITTLIDNKVSDINQVDWTQVKISPEKITVTLKPKE